MKIIWMVALAAFAVGCGKSNKSDKPGNRFLSPLSGHAVCQGPALVNSLDGNWSDYVEGASDFVDLSFNYQGQLTLTLACQAPDGGFFTNSTRTNFQVSANQVSVNNHQPLQVRTGSLNCELESMGGLYTYHFQGQCLVLNDGQQSHYFAQID